jgi:hypothetical protein
LIETPGSMKNAGSGAISIMSGISSKDSKGSGSILFSNGKSSVLDQMKTTYY